VPNIYGTKWITPQGAWYFPKVLPVTTANCLTKVCESPDILCPSCGRTMSIWIWNDDPLYRCDSCNGIGFKVTGGRIGAAYASGEIVPSDMECPGCSGRMDAIMADEWRLDSCRECEWVFATPLKEDPDTSDVNVGGTRYTAMLNWIGGVYEKIVHRLDG